MKYIPWPRKRAPQKGGGCIECGQLTDRLPYCEPCKFWLGADPNFAPRPGFCEYCQFPTESDHAPWHSVCIKAADHRLWMQQHRKDNRRGLLVLVGFVGGLAAILVASNTLPSAPWLDSPPKCTLDGLSSALASSPNTSGTPSALGSFEKWCRVSSISMLDDGEHNNYDEAKQFADDCRLESGDVQLVHNMTVCVSRR